MPAAAALWYRVGWPSSGLQPPRPRSSHLPYLLAGNDPTFPDGTHEATIPRESGPTSQGDIAAAASSFR
jgi:hypothetical protein